MCPHTAIGYMGLAQYKAQCDAGIFLSTAHPVKFLDVVEPLIGEKLRVPARLQKIIEKEKHTVNIPPSFERLKEYLLHT
jgi:threonine synthase